MTANEQKLAAHVLRMASNEFSNHGCNDFNLAQIVPDQAERDALVRAYHEWNGDLEEMERYGWLEQAQPGSPDYRLMDFMVMDFMAARLDPEGE